MNDRLSKLSDNTLNVMIGILEPRINNRRTMLDQYVSSGHYDQIYDVLDDLVMDQADHKMLVDEMDGRQVQKSEEFPLVAESQDSNVIRAITWDPQNGLIVSFHGGNRYRYQSAPRQVFESMGDSPSWGRFYNWHVKGHYTGAQIDEYNESIE